MFDSEGSVCAPGNATWVELTRDLLRGGDRERWVELATCFRPVDLRPADEMTEMLRDGIAKGCLEFPTHLLHNDNDGLLGFFSVEPQRLDIGGRMRPVLMLSSIVRSATTDPGFGRVLVEEAVGCALTDRSVRALLVEPANKRVGRMWREDYHFVSLDKPSKPGLLYFPVNIQTDGEVQVNGEGP